MVIPLHVASKYASADIFRLILEWGADMNIIGEYSCHTALQVACYEGKMEIVQLLIEWGANVNIHRCTYCSALIAASVEVHRAIVHNAIAEKLLSHGADVNFNVEKCGNTFQDSDSDSMSENTDSDD